MGKILSIVIPTYNMQDYLRRCLDSLIVSEELMKQLEVLVINDGSKDNSSAIAHEYQEKYPETFRVIDKENGGHGSCCNVGLRYATGKYIRFLDSDDWFDATDFPKFMDLLTQIDCDLILANYVEDYVYKKFSRNIDYCNKCNNKIYLAKEFPFNLFDSFSTLHRSTFKTEPLRQSSIIFTEKASFDDTVLYILPFKTIKTIYCTDFHVYHYFIGREGQSINGVDERKVNMFIHEFKKLVSDYLSIRNSFLSKKQIDFFDSFLNRITFSEVYKQAFLLPTKQAEKVLSHWDSYINSLSISRKKDIPYCLLYEKYPFFISKLLFKLICKKNAVLRRMGIIK